jgi:hypothetical protein
MGPKSHKGLNFSRIPLDVEALLTEGTKKILESKDPHSQAIIQIAKGLKERLAHEHFVGAKHINIAMMQYAMELIDQEEKEE